VILGKRVKEWRFEHSLEIVPNAHDTKFDWKNRGEGGGPLCYKRLSKKLPQNRKIS